MRGLLVGGPYDGTEVEIEERELESVVRRLVPTSSPTDLYASESLTFRGRSRVERDGRVRLVHCGPLPSDDGPVSHRVGPGR